jgi:hypothetical protein
VILSGMMVLFYLIPGSGGTLTAQEAVIICGWILLGIIFYIMCRIKYKKQFGIM